MQLRTKIESIYVVTSILLVCYFYKNSVTEYIHSVIPIETVQVVEVQKTTKFKKKKDGTLTKTIVEKSAEVKQETKEVIAPLPLSHKPDYRLGIVGNALSPSLSSLGIEGAVRLADTPIFFTTAVYPMQRSVSIGLSMEF